MAGASVAFALNNANKRSAVLDPADAADRDRLIDLAAAADIVVDSGNPGRTAAFGTSCAELSQQFAHLVAMSVTDFGADGPRASWRATDPVLYAMSTALSRSGPTAGRPVLPPNGIASATAAVQAAWAALVAYYNRLRYGTGDYIDFSRFEAVVQSLDPPFGSEGQAAVGQKRSNELWRGRPRNQQIYPTFECQGRLRQDLPAVGTPMAGNASVAGGAGAVSGPEVRHDRRAVRRVSGDQRPHRRVVRDADDGRASHGGAGARGADRRGAQPGRDVELRALPIRRRADRRRPSHRAWTSPCLLAPLSSMGAMRDSCGRRRRWVMTKQPGAHHDPSPRPDPTPPPRTGRSTVFGFWISA